MRRPASSFGPLLSAIAGGGLVAALSLFGAFRAFDLPVGDLLLRLPDRADPATSPVAAIVVDDAALELLGPLPWPRERLATLVDAAFAAGARALAIDLVLTEPGTEAGDRSLAVALHPAGSPRPVVLAAALRPDGGWLLPLVRFGGAGRAAHAEGEVGPDGVVRTILSTKQRAGIALPALSLAAARLMRQDLAVTPGAPLSPDFRLPPRRVPWISAVEVLALAAKAAPPRDGPSAERGDPLTARVEDRLVFLGITATATTDQFLVPTGGGPTPGVLIHASAAASLLAPPGAHALLRPLPPLALLAACLALAALAQLARGRAGRLRLLHFALAAIALAGAGALALWAAGIRVPLVTLAAAFGASALLREAAESARAQRETGRLLRLLVEAELEGPPAPRDEPPGPAPSTTSAPRGATGRLALARELQERVIRDRDLRRALLDSLEDGVIRWGAGGRVVLANAAAGGLWSGRRGDPAPSRHELLAAAGRAGAPAADDTPGEGAADGGTLLRRGGRQLRLQVRPLDDGGALGVLRDVTAERELEDRRREMQRLVSHELKTPLSSIASFGGMLERYQLSDEELARIAGLIRGESERLLDMVTTFLDLERLGGGRWTGERVPVDLAAVVRERRELLAGAAEDRDQTLDVEADGPCPVSGDAALLARVIDNLVGNAIKYTPGGGHIRLGVHRSAGPIEPPELMETIEPSQTIQTVELTVADDGPGIPAEALPRLFDRFYRVPGGSPAGSNTAGGSGLGLALVREIAEWHGGCVSVASEAGRGSVFTVRLPALHGAPHEGDRS